MYGVCSEGWRVVARRHVGESCRKKRWRPGEGAALGGWSPARRFSWSQEVISLSSTPWVAGVVRTQCWTLAGARMAYVTSPLSSGTSAASPPPAAANAVCPATVAVGTEGQREVGAKAAGLLLDGHVVRSYVTIQSLALCCRRIGCDVSGSLSFWSHWNPEDLQVQDVLRCGPFVSLLLVVGVSVSHDSKSNFSRSNLT